MINKVIKAERKHEYTHTLVLTLEKPVSDLCIPDELISDIDEVWKDWDCSKNVFYFYNIPDDLEDTYKERLTEILEKYA